MKTKLIIALLVLAGCFTSNAKGINDDAENPVAMSFHNDFDSFFYKEPCFDDAGQDMAQDANLINGWNVYGQVGYLLGKPIILPQGCWRQTDEGYETISLKKVKNGDFSNTILLKWDEMIPLPLPNARSEQLQ